MIQVSVTKDHVLEAWMLHPTFRTAEQFQIVADIVNSPEFDFAVTPKAFEPDESCADYQGRFTFTWYAKDGTLRATSISSKGHRVFTVVA